jgi:photosystem II stability/assembly factor-like uncharacterized protein
MAHIFNRATRHFRSANVLALLTGLSACIPAAAYANFSDPISTPADSSLLPTSAPLIAVTQAGSHFVAVGPRGLIVYSADGVATDWTQAIVPVQTDLLSVQFTDANNGWACGHNGVVLHTVDGGKTWAKQLDGVSAKPAFETYYQRQIAGGNKVLAADLQQIQLNFDPGPTLPWLSVWFQTNLVGYAVGSFGDIAMTADGGKTWQPWLEHIDNPTFLDLDAIRNVGGNLYIVGEQGSVYEYDATAQKFVAKPTGYAGMFVGITGSATSIIVFGLAGTIYRSVDEGKSWRQSADPSDATIMDGTVLADGRVVLVNIDGGVLISNDDGKNFRLSPKAEDAPLSGIFAAGDSVVITSLGGIKNASP